MQDGSEQTSQQFCHMKTDFYKRYKVGCSEKYPNYENLLQHCCGLLSLMAPGPTALWLWLYGPDPTALYSCFKNSEKWRCSVFVNLHVLRVLFCQPVFSIFEFYAGNYAFVFAFEY